jgi:hypothetical protein
LSTCKKCVKQPGTRNTVASLRYALVYDTDDLSVPESIPGGRKYDNIVLANRDRTKFPGTRVVTISERRLV